MPFTKEIIYTENSVTSQMRYPQKRDVYATHYGAHFIHSFIRSFVHLFSSKFDRFPK